MTARGWASSHGLYCGTGRCDAHLYGFQMEREQEKSEDQSLFGHPLTACGMRQVDAMHACMAFE